MLPEELEEKTHPLSHAELRGAGMDFFDNNRENDGNPGGLSELVAGEGDAGAVPFPRPHPLLTDRGNTQ